MATCWRDRKIHKLRSENGCSKDAHVRHKPIIELPVQFSATQHKHNSAHCEHESLQPERNDAIRYVQLDFLACESTSS